MPLGEALTSSPWALAQWINASLPYLNKVGTCMCVWVASLCLCLSDAASWHSQGLA